MSDDRTISGPVNVVNADGAAKVAADMAERLWYETHSRSPNMNDDAFLELVRKCARSLKGNPRTTPQ